MTGLCDNNAGNKCAVDITGTNIPFITSRVLCYHNIKVLCCRRIVDLRNRNGRRIFHTAKTPLVTHFVGKRISAEIIGVTFIFYCWYLRCIPSRCRGRRNRTMRWRRYELNIHVIAIWVICSDPSVWWPLVFRHRNTNILSRGNTVDIHIHHECRWAGARCITYFEEKWIPATACSVTFISDANIRGWDRWIRCRQGVEFHLSMRRPLMENKTVRRTAIRVIGGNMKPIRPYSGVRIGRIPTSVFRWVIDGIYSYVELIFSRARIVIIASLECQGCRTIVVRRRQVPYWRTVCLCAPACRRTRYNLNSNRIAIGVSSMSIHVGWPGVFITGIGDILGGRRVIIRNYRCRQAIISRAGIMVIANLVFQGFSSRIISGREELDFGAANLRLPTGWLWRHLYSNGISIGIRCMRVSQRRPGIFGGGNRDVLRARRLIHVIDLYTASWRRRTWLTVACTNIEDVTICTSVYPASDFILTATWSWIGYCGEMMMSICQGNTVIICITRTYLSGCCHALVDCLCCRGNSYWWCMVLVDINRNIPVHIPVGITAIGLVAIAAWLDVERHWWGGWSYKALGITPTGSSRSGRWWYVSPGQGRSWYNLYRIRPIQTTGIRVGDAVISPVQYIRTWCPHQRPLQQETNNQQLERSSCIPTLIVHQFTPNDLPSCGCEEASRLKKTTLQAHLFRFASILFEGAARHHNL